MNVALARGHQRLEPFGSLFIARGLLGRFRAAEAQELSIDDDVDVFGEPLDQPPALGERRAALEGQMGSGRRQAKERSERPAHPEVLLNAAGTEPKPAAGFLHALPFDGLR